MPERVLAKPRRKRWAYLAAPVVLVGVVVAVVIVMQRRRAGETFPELRASFAGESKSLSQTRIVATLDAPIEKGKNLIWCAGFACAWKKMQANVAGGPLVLDGAEEACARLNAAADPSPDVPQDGLYANGGWVAKGIIDTIRKEMGAKFPGVAAPSFAEAGPDGAVAFAYLKANLQFTAPYFQARRPLDFTDSGGKKTPLRAFGIRREDYDRYHELREQAQILYLHGGNRMELDTEYAVDPDRSSQPNQIVVARIRPEATLEKTLASLDARIKAWSPETVYRQGNDLESNDSLLVPDIFWRVSHRFAELEGQKFRGGPMDGMPLARAWQDMEFRLDRSGVHLETKAGLMAKSEPMEFHFDRPFLLYLKKRGASRPFFVMWIDNAELLQRWPEDVAPAGKGQ